MVVHTGQRRRLCSVPNLQIRPLWVNQGQYRKGTTPKIKGAPSEISDGKGPVRDISSLQYFGVTGEPRICSFTQNKAWQVSDVSTAIHIPVLGIREDLG